MSDTHTTLPLRGASNAAPPIDCLRGDGPDPSATLPARSTPPYESLTRLAARLLGAAGAFVVLVDADRDESPRASGGDAPSPSFTARNAPLVRRWCDEVSRARRPLTIRDARTRGTTLDDAALGGRLIQSFAGVPLLASDATVYGTLCVLDVQPRDWSPADLTTLGEIAAAVVTEVTLRRSIGRLAASETRYRSAIDAMREGIVLYGVDGFPETWNDSAERILGLSGAELASRRPNDPRWRAVHEDGTPMDPELRPIAVTLRTGVAQENVVGGVYRPDGRMAWLLINTRALVRSGEARPYGCVVTYSDISRRKEAEAALRESEARFRGILETTRSVAMCLDTEGYVTFCNDALLTLTGWTRDEVIGVDWFTRFLPADLDLRPSFERILAAEETAYHSQRDIITRTGERRTISWDSTVFRDAAGRVVGTASVGQDVTDVVHAARLKDELIGVATHEIRTPLTAVRGALELLVAMRADGDERERQLLAMATRNVDRLVRLAGNLLDAERIESGTALLQPHVIQAGMLLTTARDMAHGIADLSRVQLIVQPPPTDALAVWGDAERIGQVLSNLIGNAIKFSAAGGTITLGVEPCDDAPDMPSGSACFWVSDQGRGIPTHKLERIFERFEQVDPADPREKMGAGLGLAISRAIVRQHGGRIWVESELGVGSTFYFTLPTADTGIAQASQRT